MVADNNMIKEALNKGEIEVKVYDWSESEKKFSKKNLSQENAGDSHKIFLTVGFLLKTLSRKKWINPEHLFNGQDGIVDLRKMKDQTYMLHPGESVIFYTKEYIHLGKNFFGLVYPMIRLGSKSQYSGLVLSPSYIDPDWKGIIQLQVTNETEHKKSIKIGHLHATLVLLTTKQEIPYTDQQNSTHYKLQWEHIDNQSETQWTARERSIVTKVKHKVRTNYKKLLFFVTATGLLDFATNIIGIVYFFRTR